MSHKSRNIEVDGTIFKRHITELNLSLANLEASLKKQNRQVLPDLRKLQDEKGLIDIFLIIRQCMELVRDVHSGMRKILQSDLLRWEGLVEERLQEYEEITGYVAAIDVIEHDDSESITQQFSLFRDFIERRRVFEKRTRYFRAYSSSFVSNEPFNSNIE